MSIESKVAVSGEAWKVSSYYDDAEKWTFMFWDEDKVFRKFFNMLDVTRIAELACGHGRHSAQVLSLDISDQIETLSLLDIFESNIEACENRLKGMHPGLNFIKGDGFTFRPLLDCSLTSIFCYDAMVHFEPELVQSYLRDTFRVLAEGGRALYHHSNLQLSKHPHYGMNPNARNVMPWDYFRKAVKDAGLDLYDTRVIEWDGVPGLDRVSLLEKPIT